MGKVIETININSVSNWIRVESGSDVVEGKLHHLDSNQKLVIFEPGFPGDGSSRLERLWLGALLENNFTVFAIRHVGTVINGKYAATYLNCPERQELAKSNGERFLGGKELYTIADWLVEPLIALKVFAAQFDEIYLVGHSFGGLASFYSLIEFARLQPDAARKIKRIISPAGSTGLLESKNDPILRQWSDYLRKSSIRERIEIGDPDENLEILENAYRKIHSEANLIPAATEVICVMVENDELVSEKEGEEIIKTLGRGYLIRDTLEVADENSGRLAHDMDNLPPEKFLNLVDLAWKPKGKDTAF